MKIKVTGNNSASRNLPRKAVNESTMINATDHNYEIYTISMDIAVPPEKAYNIDMDTSYIGNLYSKISAALEKCGYEMASDMIEYDNGDTSRYQGLDYEFFEE